MTATPTPAAPSAPTTLPDRTPRRVRHELRFRQLTVHSVQRVTPHLVRITLGGDDLDGFTSPGFDDHCKLFFPDPATGVLVVPTPGPDGPVWPAGVAKPAMRDFTPGAFDAQARTLTLDFALHEAGPATRWAERARPGDTLGVGGPRGSFIIPTAFDWHLLIGDDTALPAIARRLAELPAGARAVVLAEVDGPQDQIALPSAATLDLHWVHRHGAEAGSLQGLLDALDQLTLPAGDYHAWVACESSLAKALRARLLAQHGANPKWMKASGYWRRGSAATHDTHED